MFSVMVHELFGALTLPTLRDLKYLSILNYCIRVVCCCVWCFSFFFANGCVTLMLKMQTWSVCVWVLGIHGRCQCIFLFIYHKLVTRTREPCFLCLGDAFLFGTEMVPWVTSSLSRRRNSELHGKQRLCLNACQLLLWALSRLCTKSVLHLQGTYTLSIVCHPFPSPLLNVQGMLFISCLSRVSLLVTDAVTF